MQSIRKRLVSNYVVIALISVALLQSLFVVVITQYYMGGVERVLINHTETAANFFNRYAEPGDIYSKSNYIFENLDMDEKALVQVLDPNGHVVIDSTGSTTDEVVTTGDFMQAMSGEVDSWRGKSERNEHIMAVSAPLYDDNHIVGVLRHVTSLEPTYQMITRYVLLVFVCGAVVIAIAAVFGQMIAKRILTPIQELVRVTEEVAQGNYKVSAVKYHNDEIGQLVDAVNTMTKEITRADQAKNEFISSISHELRTPLTSLKGWVETLQDMKDDPQVLDEGLEIIQKETDRLIILVNDLLDFSRLQGKRLELKKEEFSIKHLLEDVYNQFEVRAHQEKIKMNLLTDNQDGKVIADYNRLKQVFVNIVDNAMKFTMGRKHAEITISSQVLDDQVVMIVEDNGTGISPSDLERVKEKFFKGSSNRSGTGLGLSIASEIMELHGGTMLIDSTLGKGTKVILALPYFFEKDAQ